VPTAREAIQSMTYSANPNTERQEKRTLQTENKYKQTRKKIIGLWIDIYLYTSIYTYAP
jgi:hypothetical protein